MRRSLAAFLFTGCLSGFIATTAIAQSSEHLSPFAHGAGRSYVTQSSGIAASGLNPALLGQGLGRDKAFEFNLPLVGGIDAGASMTNFDTLEYAFKDTTGNSFSNETRRRLTRLVSGDKMSGSGDYQVLGLAYGREGFGAITFTWNAHVATRTDLPLSLLSHVRNAEADLTSQDFDASNLYSRTQLWRDFTLSFGHEISKADPTPDVFLHDLAVGIGVKLVQGIAYAGLEPNSVLKNRPGNELDTITASYKLRYAALNNIRTTFLPSELRNPPGSSSDLGAGDFLTGSAGSGFGLDLGVSAGLLNNNRGVNIMRVGLSITDIGSINWTENTLERSFDSLAILRYDAGSEIDSVNEQASMLQGKLSKIGAFSTSLPTTFRFGLAYNLGAAGIMDMGNSDLVATAETALGLNDAPGSPSSGRLSLGLGWRTYSTAVAFRAGIGLAFQQGTDVTLGLGTTIGDALLLDFASSRITQLFSDNSRTDWVFGIRVLI